MSSKKSGVKRKRSTDLKPQDESKKKKTTENKDAGTAEQESQDTSSTRRQSRTIEQKTQDTSRTRRQSRTTEHHSQGTPSTSRQNSGETAKQTKQGGTKADEFYEDLQENSEWIVRHRGKTLALDHGREHWYSKDTAGHGGAALKKFDDKRRRLEFCGSMDKDMNFMDEKHESKSNTYIKKSECQTVRRYDT